MRVGGRRDGISRFDWETVRPLLRRFELRLLRSLPNVEGRRRRRGSPDLIRVGRRVGLGSPDLLDPRIHLLLLTCIMRSSDGCTSMWVLVLLESREGGKSVRRSLKEEKARGRRSKERKMRSRSPRTRRIRHACFPREERAS